MNFSRCWTILLFSAAVAREVHDYQLCMKSHGRNAGVLVADLSEKGSALEAALVVANDITSGIATCFQF